LARLKLYTTMASPFGRKARMGAIICGLDDRIDVVAIDLANPPPEFLELTPLGKVPTLVDADGTPIYDSRVILSWMDREAGGDLILPRDPTARMEALRLQALADGIVDAGVLQVYGHRYRPEEMRSAMWLERQEAKIRRGLAQLEAAKLRFQGGPPHVGEIALAALLGFSDSHFAGAWRPDYPGLYAWLDSFAAAVPAWERTRVKPVS